LIQTLLSLPPLQFSEFSEALENFARDLPDLEEDPHDFDSPPDSPSEHPHHNETPEPPHPDSLNYFLFQFPFFDLPIPEGTFCVGPGRVKHQDLLNLITTAPSDSVIPWYFPGYQLPLAVPVQALWRRFPPSTGRIEEL